MNTSDLIPNPNPNDLFSHQFIDGLYFSRNLSHHEDLAVARYLPRFDEGFDYSLIISATKEII